jgi:hypothetical protein
VKPAELAAGEERAAAKAVAVGFELVDETGREAVPKPATLDGERESQRPESRDPFEACDPLAHADERREGATRAADDPFAVELDHER